MLRLLLADDEGFVRRGILSSVDWKACGVDEVLEAEDGRQALEIAKKQRPEIILSDIRMPLLSGIGLVDALKDEYRFQIIFMSAYSDKEYLKSAIKLHAVDYVEKPIVLAELTAAIQKAAQEIESDRLRARQPDPRTALHNLLFFGGDAPKISGVFFSHFKGFEVLVISEEEGMPRAPETAQGLELVQIFHEGNLLVLLCAHREAAAADFDRYTATIPLDGHLVTRGGIQAFAPGIPASYRRALRLQEELFWTGYGHLLWEKPCPTAALDEKTLLKDFSDNLLSLKTTRIEAALGRCAGSLAAARPKTTAARLFLYQLYRQIEEGSTKMGCACADPDALSRLNCFKTLEEGRQYLLERINDFIKAAQMIPEAAILTAKIDGVIAGNYQDSTLGIAIICAKVFSSRSTVCTVYKRETGRTLNEAILEYRVSQACRLLQNEKNSLSAIAEDTGFTDQNYFTKSFKKLIGITPSTYRKELR